MLKTKQMKKIIFVLLFSPLSMWAQNIDSLGNQSSKLWKTRAIRNGDSLYIPSSIKKDSIIVIPSETIKVRELVEPNKSFYIIPTIDANGILFEIFFNEYLIISREKIDQKYIWKITNTDTVPHLFINTIYAKKYKRYD